MATRCNIVVTIGGKQWQSRALRLVLYRHWDGYPSVTGADLARHALAAHDGHAFVGRLLVQSRDGQPDTREYELTPALHGDVEHVYLFEWLAYGGPVTRILHAERPAQDWSTPVEQWARKGTTAYDLAAWITFCNHEIEDANRRVQRLNDTRGTAYDLFPLIDVPTPAAVDGTN